MKDKTICRRDFVKYVGVGVLDGVLLSLLGCQNNSMYQDLPEPTVRPVQMPRPILDQPTDYHDNINIVDRPLGLPHAPWMPQKQEDITRWQGIVIHHTATDKGPASEIDKIHRRRGFDGLGYDFVINNGSGAQDGKVEVGYRWQNQLTGAHCRPNNCFNNYWNEHTIGIVLIGNFDQTKPTRYQYQSLAELVGFLQQRYRISDQKVLGHRQVPGCKTHCPGQNFSWYTFNTLLKRLG
ncbi:MAG: N-acetylmuramoyl-L-alanine amidase [Sedimentisphaerales bacterium]|nr:N-acetylmuramoyl-L-alanine amidase [Sedimentisphaerales bacterium]